MRNTLVALLLGLLVFAAAAISAGSPIHQPQTIAAVNGPVNPLPHENVVLTEDPVTHKLVLAHGPMVPPDPWTGCPIGCLMSCDATGRCPTSARPLRKPPVEVALLR